MRASKKLTLSAMLVALGAVLMAIGGYVEVLDLTVCAVVSLLVAFSCVEIGSPYTWLIWLATSLATFLIQPGKSLWLLYLLIFGIYPILKGFIERAARPLWYLFKLLFVNAVLALLTYVWELIFGVALVPIENKLIVIGVYAVMNIAFIAYDMFITVMMRIYFAKFRNRIKNLLK